MTSIVRVYSAFFEALFYILELYPSLKYIFLYLLLLSISKGLLYYNLKNY